MGINHEEGEIVGTDKNLMVSLSIFMSIGGLVWGSLLLYFNLTWPATIAYVYVAFSVLNVLAFKYSKIYQLASSTQIMTSLFLPFLLQWSIGGCFASGCVMLWSLLSLVGVIISMQGNRMYIYLFLFITLVVISYWSDPFFAKRTPAIPNSGISLSLLLINILMITSAFFLLLTSKVRKDDAIRGELEHLQETKQQNLVREAEIGKRLQESENLYRNLVEESQILICKHKLNGDLISVNHIGAKILGYQQQDLVGTNLERFIAPEFLNEYRSYLEHIGNFKTHEGFLTVFTRNNEKRIFLFKNILIKEDGHEPYVIGSAQDVTEWRKAESREHKVRKELQMIVSSVDDFVVEFDESACFKNLWCRDESKLFMPVRLFLGKTIAEVFSHLPKFSEEAQRIYNQTILSGNSVSVELEDPFSKVPSYYLIRLNPLREKDGIIRRCTALITNITPRKLTEKRLNESFQTQNLLLENLDGGVIIEDANRRISLVNNGFCELFNIPLRPSEMIQMDCSKSAEEVKHFFVESSSFPVRVEHILREKVKVINEELKMLDNRILERDYIPIIFQDKYQGHLWHYRDITNRKQAEHALKAAKEEAEKSNRLKTIFLGNLSHEVRTPIQGILGFAEILENSKLNEKKRLEYLNIIKQRTGDMLNIIESLLDLASLETGEIRAFPAALNLSEAITAVFIRTKQDQHVTGKSIQLFLDNTIEESSLIHIDCQHLSQVLINLMNNALKFTNAGSITLQSTQCNSHYKICIKDTGVGIPEDKVQYIFEPFRQVHEGMSRSKGGIGLGLAICKKMVEMWGGKIQVESHPGKGSTFSFTIPFSNIKPSNEIFVV